MQTPMDAWIGEPTNFSTFAQTAAPVQDGFHWENGNAYLDINHCVSLVKAVDDRKEDDRK